MLAVARSCSKVMMTSKNGGWVEDVGDDGDEGNETYSSDIFARSASIE